MSQADVRCGQTWVHLDDPAPRSGQHQIDADIPRQPGDQPADAAGDAQRLLGAGMAQGSLPADVTEARAQPDVLRVQGEGPDAAGATEDSRAGG